MAEVSGLPSTAFQTLGLYVTREEFRTAATTLGFKPATLRQWRRRRAIPAAKSRLVSPASPTELIFAIFSGV